MKNIVLFGPPGSGKGTQATNIINKYHLIHLSTGDMLRAEIAGQTKLGLEAKSLMDKGELVPDAVVIGMIESKLDANPKAAGFVFDGFPRTVGQAEALDALLAKKNAPIQKVLSLKVSEDELTKRILERGKTSGRADDQNEEIVKNRVVEYRTKTEPLANYYAKQHKLVEIQGEGTVDHIADLLNYEIDSIDEKGAPEHKSFLSEVGSFISHTVEDLLHSKSGEKKPEVKTEGERVPFPLHSVVDNVEAAAKKAVKKVEDVVKEAVKNSEPAKKLAKEVRSVIKKGAAKKPVKKVAAIVKKAAPKKVEAAAQKAVKKAAAVVKKAAKKVAPKKAVKKAPVKKVAAVAKKAAKKVTPKKAAAVVKKAAKKVAPKKVAAVAKKAAKKVAPKKVTAVVKKAAKKVAPKKAIKRAAAAVKKAVKKVAPKKAVKKAPAKKVVAKKAVRKAAPKKAAKKAAPKKIAPKKVVKKAAPKKVAKKAVKKASAKNKGRK